MTILTRAKLRGRVAAAMPLRQVLRLSRALGLRVEKTGGEIKIYFPGRTILTHFQSGAAPRKVTSCLNRLLRA